MAISDHNASTMSSSADFDPSANKHRPKHLAGKRAFRGNREASLYIRYIRDIYACARDLLKRGRELAVTVWDSNQSVSGFGYFDFRVTARPRRVHGSDDTLYMQAQYWPLRIAQHDERDCANG